MAYVFNPFIGILENINVSSSMSSDGDLQVGNPAITSRDFFEAHGIKYFLLNLGGSSGPLIGQPIPIGMGLTITYSRGFVYPPITIKQGQPIPIGMGLTQTYAKDVT